MVSINELLDKELPIPDWDLIGWLDEEVYIDERWEIVVILGGSIILFVGGVATIYLLSNLTL